MPRLPMVPPEPDDEIVASVFSAFTREGRAPIALYRVLAHSPELLRAYSVLPRTLRASGRTPRRLRELVILRVAQLVGSDYEWSHHKRMALDAGVPEGDIAALASWRESEAFSVSERAALRAAEELHDVALSDEAFAELSACFEPDEIVELLLTASIYEAVARLLQGFAIEVEPEYRPYLD